MSGPDTPGCGRVTILMALYRGAAHVGEQLHSFAAQQGVAWDLIVSDDGGGDTGAQIVREFAGSAAGQGHRITLRPGPQQGFSANFMTLIASQLEATGPVALSDQDDIWLPQKLSRAVAQLAALPGDQPALYCSRRWVWNPQTDTRHPSRAYDRPPEFANALIENVAPGNTIVLNAAAASLAAQAARGCGPVFAHDWWLYLLLSGAGARIIVDPEPTLLYRQHGQNALGAGERFQTRALNKVNVLRGHFRQRVGMNLAALKRTEQILTPENRRILSLFFDARQAPLPRRVALLRQAGVYRQSTMSSLGFWGAACLGRI